MKTVVDRKAAREAIAASILAGIPAFQHVYDEMPKDMLGESPVCHVESDGWQPVMEDAQDLFFIIGVWARRDGVAGSGMDAAAAEDTLDTLGRALALLMHKEYNAEFYQKSDKDYAEIVDGIVYALELYYLKVQWW